MIKLSWSQPMAPWTTGSILGKGEKFSAWPTTDMKLGTSGHRVGTWTGAGVTATLGLFLIAVRGALELDIGTELFHTLVHSLELYHVTLHFKKLFHIGGVLKKKTIHDNILQKLKLKIRLFSGKVNIMS